MIVVNINDNNFFLRMYVVILLASLVIGLKTAWSSLVHDYNGAIW